MAVFREHAENLVEGPAVVRCELVVTVAATASSVLRMLHVDDLRDEERRWGSQQDEKELKSNTSSYIGDGDKY